MKLITSILLLVTLLTVSATANTPKDLTEKKLIEIKTEEKIDFVVIYEEGWDGDSDEFTAILKTYNLEKGSSSNIGGGLVCLHLYSTTQILYPIEIGKKISIANDSIAMVQINNIEPTSTSTI